tara:strand:- start:1236 stop:1772 length:537 start_codon:yes stop_codon:yes gene_type:complete
MGLGSFLFGSRDKLSKKQTYTPQQMQFLNQLLGALGGGQGGQEGQGGNFLDYYSNLLGGDQGQGDFESFAEPYRQEFQNQTIPMLAERFAGAGGAGAGGMSGALSSSGFGQSLGAAGSNFNAQLAQLFAGLRQSAAGQMSGLAGLGLGAQPYAFQQKSASPGFLTSGLAGFMQGFGGR